ncbi:cell division protein FtsZ [Asticcacaulis excentricus]|uniref:Cell division protein FtsZ n=1 Tax=Asticcacaulis excentricus TaxID=78587 RepID=A0A3G9G7N2_9CAUL|nr:cell division protein FtsZ [Asticcacaulis excentricus]BBF80318.1 cell division protein FtsH [Asticcacaulis excentricus]
MAIHLSAPRATELKPRIVVFGVGGAGGNAVNNMIEAGLEGVEFVVANTDAQQLQFAKTDRRVQLGVSLTQGLGAGAHPEVGMTAAEESAHEIGEHLEGAHMVFITAGMGGGTGTGAAPIIAKTARERGILTVGVVTKPFMFEGRHRMRLADAGIAELQRYVDTLIVIPNQNLFRIANERTTFAEAFGMADQVLHSGVRSITDLMVLPGLINLDFADVRSVMSEMGKAMMGTGEATGDDRALQAAQNAIQNPLLDETSLKGAKAVLVNVTGGLDMTLLEVDEAANAISSEVDPDANIIFGAAFDPSLEGKLRVSVVATGMDSAAAQQQPPVPQATASTPPRQSIYITPGRPGQAQPVQTVAVQAPLSQATAAPAPQPAPVQPAPVAETPVQPAYQPEVRPEPVAATPAPQPAPAPVAQPEPRIIAKIVDPSVEDEFDIPAVQSAPQSVQREIPQRPVAGYGTTRAPEPARAAVQSPREDDRGGLWRGLFPKRSDAPVTQTPEYRQPSAPAPSPYATAPAPQAAPQAAAKSDVLPGMEAEDDLEIPSFLRRLAN